MLVARFSLFLLICVLYRASALRGTAPAASLLPDVPDDYSSDIKDNSEAALDPEEAKNSAIEPSETDTADDDLSPDDQNESEEVGSEVPDMSNESPEETPTNEATEQKVASAAPEQEEAPAASVQEEPAAPVQGVTPAAPVQEAIPPVEAPVMPQAEAPAEVVKEKTAAQLLEEAKPKVPEELVEILTEFHQNPPAESCMEVVEDMQASEGAQSAYYPMFVAVGLLDPANHESKAQSISADKEVTNALKILYEMNSKEAVSSSSENYQDLHSFTERLIRCKVTQEHDRTMLQQICLMGLEDTLATSFVETLMKGTADDSPLQTTDKYGNNLLHLSVMSGAFHISMQLVSISQKINFAEASRSMNNVYWVLSALQQKNQDGKLPLEVSPKIGLTNKLKRYFRLYANFLKIKRRTLNLKSEIFDNLDEILKTSGMDMPPQARL